MTTLLMSPLNLVRGDDNIYDVDLDVAVSVSDQVWFFAKSHWEDADADAVIKKGMNVTGLSGIVIIDQPTGRVQVQIAPADTADLVDHALHYDVQFKGAVEGKVRTVARGVLLLSGEVTQATS